MQFHKGSGFQRCTFRWALLQCARGEDERKKKRELQDGKLDLRGSVYTHHQQHFFGSLVDCSFLSYFHDAGVVRSGRAKTVNNEALRVCASATTTTFLESFPQQIQTCDD